MLRNVVEGSQMKSLRLMLGKVDTRKNLLRTMLQKEVAW